MMKKKNIQCAESLECFFDFKFLKAIGDEKRLRLLCSLLCNDDCCCVSDLNACCSIDFSVVSRHLKTLKEAGIVSSEKKGKEVYYQIEGEALLKKLKDMTMAIESCLEGKRSKKRGRNATKSTKNKK